MNNLSDEQILELLTPIFREVFDDDMLVISTSTVADDVDEWDSLSHIRLIVSIEKRFGVKFAAAEIEKLENVGGLIALLRSRAAS